MVALRAMRTTLAAWALALASAPSAAPSGACTLTRVAEWQVRPTQGQPIIDGALNGQPIGIMVDTGATRSMIVRSAADRLDLVRRGTRASRIMGIGGETAVETLSVDEIAVGSDVRHHWRMLVAGEHDLGPDVAVVLGEDFFGQADVEFDLAHGAVRFFEARDCGGASLAYWSHERTGVIDIEGGGVQRGIAFSVAVNGRPVTAVLDSGAYPSVVTKSQAAEVGVTPDSPGVAAGGCSVGLGSKPIEFWFGPFKSFRIGDELIRDPVLRFADLWKYSTIVPPGSHVARKPLDRPDMLLGADFLRTHRVFVAHSQRKMYFTYEGGTVFPNPPAGPCS